MTSQQRCDENCYKNGKGCILSETGICLHINFINKNYSNKDYYKKPKGLAEGAQVKK